MAHRPKRTFRQRRADSSDSDSTQEPFAEPGAPGEQADLGPAEEGLPSGGVRAEAAELPRRARGRGRGRGRVWASSRHAARAAPRLDGGSDVLGDAGQQDEEDGTHRSSESKDDQSSSSNSSSSLEEEFTSLGW
ncbi:hypothetical protein EI555_000490 [Monodon monoceros]|uniref:Uncharacterized protein n=1 Tax=Monodon monoceros TaxID=40151 RepID=A0A4U1EGV2_MONMO|nr:hypothetical protein EI555_000490 [Monodon monoceros]